MERYITNTMTIERKGIFDKNRKKRFELTFTCKDSILNNLIPMGYTTITICNLYGELFKQCLKPSQVPNNTENRKYLEEVLKREFHDILLGYGNTFLTNKFVKEKKAYLRKLLNSYKEKVLDIVDDKGEYERLTAIHPLMAGKAVKVEDRKQSEKILISAKEEGEKKSYEKGGSNQNSKPVAPVEATE